MADGDPLRASEIFENISAEWWNYWIVWRSEKNKAESKK
jgi:hypothetical protein